MDRHEQYIEKHYDEFQVLRDMLITLSKSDPPGDLERSTVNRAIFEKGNYTIKHGRTQEGRFANIREYTLFTDMVRLSRADIYDRLLPALWVSADGEYLIMPAWQRMRAELIQPGLGYPKFLPRRVYGNLVLFMDQPVLLDYFAYAPGNDMEPISKPTPPCSGYEENFRMTISDKVKQAAANISATHANDINLLFTRKEDHVKKMNESSHDVVVMKMAKDPKGSTTTMTPWEHVPDWVNYRAVFNDEVWWLSHRISAYGPHWDNTWAGAWLSRRP